MLPKSQRSKPTQGSTSSTPALSATQDRQNKLRQMEYSELDFLKDKLQNVTDIYEKFIAMKKITLQILFLFIAPLAQAQTIELVPKQLFGTWHASYTTGGGYGYEGVINEFFFTLYEDYRSYSVMTNGIVTNGTWYVEDDLFFSRSNSEYALSKLQTISFKGSKWIYKGLSDNTIYYATKLSTNPKALPKIDFYGKTQYLEEPYSSIISLPQIYGTWKSKNNTDGTEFNFTIYPDQRMYITVTDGVSGSWTIAGNKFFFYLDYVPDPLITKTTSFSTSAWNYQSLEDGSTYTATKISNIPQKITPKKKPITPQKQPAKATEDRSRYSPKSFTCPFCDGSCKMNCESCYGEGRIKQKVSRSVYNSGTNNYETVYEDEWFSCSDSDCINGKVKCTNCKCKSADYEDIAFHGTDKVPYDADVFGTWQTPIGENYTFFSSATSDGFLLQYKLGNLSYVGSWEIEDGLMKMFLHNGLDSQWQKYAFRSFDTKSMNLKKVSSLVEEIHLTKLK